MRTIHERPVTKSAQVTVPKGCEFLGLQRMNMVPVLLFVGQNRVLSQDGINEHTEAWDVTLHGTGEQAPEIGHYCGSVIIPGGSLKLATAVHVWRRKIL